MQAHVTPAGLSLLVLPLAVGILSIVSSLTVFRLPKVRGWKCVQPGLGYWVAVVLGLSVSCLIAWVWAFVGSSRSDGASQMRIAWWLAFLFACGTGYCAIRVLSLHLLGLMWRGNMIRWRGVAGVDMHTLASLTTGHFGFATANFRSGERVVIDLAAYRAAELIAEIEDANGLTPQDRVPEH
jgi:hypothetical protein